MNLLKNISIIHIVLIILALFLLMIPWYQLGIEFPSFIAGGKIVIDSKYFIVGFITILIILLKLWEYKLEIANKQEIDFLKSIRIASDKVLLNGLMIILAYNGFISVVIPILLVGKEILLENIKKVSADNGKMMERSMLGIFEKTCLNLGVIFILFYNLPFELWNIFLADALILIGAVMSVINGCIYFFRAKNLILNRQISE